MGGGGGRGGSWDWVEWSGRVLRGGFEVEWFWEKFVGVVVKNVCGLQFPRGLLWLEEVGGFGVVVKMEVFWGEI